jgi:hypothetical protein
MGFHHVLLHHKNIFFAVLLVGDTRWRSWLRHFATSRKLAGSSPDEVNYFQFTYSFQLHYGPGVDSDSKRNLPVGKGRRALKADNFTPSVSRLSRKCESLDVSQPFAPLRFVTGIALLLPFTLYCW